MRTKNKKWIGPVPITAVAVFALAALLSVGLWLLPPGSGVTEAQGLPASPTDPDASGDKCGVSLVGPLRNAAGVIQGSDTRADKNVAGGDCNVSAATVDVVFENTAGIPTTPGNTAKLSLVAYVTGGAKFPTVQARTSNGETALGKRGR